MKTITFHCETITPMFLAGADGQKPELRPPSIKGALRFWWRAMNGHLSLVDLKKKESEIFGGGGENASRSNIIIEVLNQPKKNDIKTAYPLPHKKPGDKGYFPKKSIQAGFEFKIKISFLKESKNFDLGKAKNLFIIFSILGGLGNRSRRGFGSFRINKIIYSDNSEEQNIEYTKQKLLQELDDVCLGNQKYSTQNNKIISNNFSGNWPWIKEIIFGKISNNYNTLLKNIGDATHNNKDNSLGLAYNSWRFASPVYISVIPNNNNYQIVITKLNIPNVNNNSITILNSKKQTKTFYLDFEKQEKFINELK